MKKYPRKSLNMELNRLDFYIEPDDPASLETSLDKAKQNEYDEYTNLSWNEKNHIMASIKSKIYRKKMNIEDSSYDILIWSDIYRNHMRQYYLVEKYWQLDDLIIKMNKLRDK